MVTADSAFKTAMALDKFTIKSQEAIERAQRVARDRGHQELSPEHLLAALLEEPEGTVAAVLQKLGVQRAALSRRERREGPAILGVGQGANGGGEQHGQPPWRRVGEGN